MLFLIEAKLNSENAIVTTQNITNEFDLNRAYLEIIKVEAKLDVEKAIITAHHLFSNPNEALYEIIKIVIFHDLKTANILLESMRKNTVDKYFYKSMEIISYAASLKNFFGEKKYILKLIRNNHELLAEGRKGLFFMQEEKSQSFKSILAALMGFVKVQAIQDFQQAKEMAQIFPKYQRSVAFYKMAKVLAEQNPENAKEAVPYIDDP